MCDMMMYLVGKLRGYASENPTTVRTQPREPKAESCLFLPGPIPAGGMSALVLSGCPSV